MAPDNRNIEFRRALAAHTKLVGTLTTLKTMISSRYADVRIEALEALNHGLSEVDLESVLRMAIHDQSELVRVTAIEIADDRALKSMLPEITARLESDKSWLVRSAAAIAMGDMSAGEARKTLEARVSLAGEEERVGFYYALVKLGVRKYLPSFLQGLSHHFYRVRCATANLIPKLIDKRNKPLFVQRVREALEQEETVAVRSSLENTIKHLSNGADGLKTLVGSD
jgi:HEAT repeat protein